MDIDLRVCINSVFSEYTPGRSYLILHACIQALTYSVSSVYILVYTCLISREYILFYTYSILGRRMRPRIGLDAQGG